MQLNLERRTAIVTGASRGIGLATVRTLISEGAHVVGVARTITPALKETGPSPCQPTSAPPTG